MADTTRGWQVRLGGVGAAVVAAGLLLLWAGTATVPQTHAQQPPDEQINIRVEDVKTRQLLPGTCWQVFYIAANQNVTFDYVGDDRKVCPNTRGTLSDKDPTPGLIRITISGALRAQFGDEWHVLMTQRPKKYNLDLIKHQCDLRLGKCEITVQTALKFGDLLMNVTDNQTTLAVAGQCFEVRSPDQVTLINAICDGDTDDKDTGPGVRVNVPFGSYSVEYDTVNIPADRIPKGTKQSCSVANTPPESRTCKSAFFVNKPTPTPTPTNTPPPPTPATVILLGGSGQYPSVGGGSGGSDGVLPFAAVAGAAALAMLGGAVWYRLRRAP